MIQTTAPTAATLADVRDAVKRGDKAGAGALLSEVLRTRPSADAWYLAAVFTSDPDETMNHLQRALLLDPNHKPSRKRLRQLTGRHSVSPLDLLVSEYRAFSYRQCDRSRWLRRLPRRFQLGVVGLLPALLLLMVFTLLFSNVTRPGPVIAEAAPPVVALRHLTADEIVPHLATSAVRIARIERLQDASALQKQSLRLVLDAPDSPTVQVIVYNSISSLLEDEVFLNSTFVANHALAANNAVLVYPRGLAAKYAAPLVAAFTSLLES